MSDQLKKYDADLVALDTETGGLNGFVDIDGFGRVLGALHYPLIELAFVVPSIVDNKTMSTEKGEKLIVGIKLNNESWISPWALEQHTKSGLLERLESGQGFDFVASSNEEAEAFIISWLEKVGVRRFNREEGSGAMLIGNNIGFDFSFIDAQMPNLAGFFHYRKIDVSAVNVLSRTLWSGADLPQPKKELNHTALSDIKESISEMNGYTKNIVK